MKLFELVSQTAGRIGQALPLGEFDRAEFITHNGRLVTQVKADRRLLVVSKATPAP